MSTIANLRALHASIGAALDDVEKAYNNHGVDFPDFDAPIYHPDSSVTSTSLAERLRKEEGVSRALATIVASCSALSSMVKDPFFNLLETCTNVRVLSFSFFHSTHTVLHIDTTYRSVEIP